MVEVEFTAPVISLVEGGVAGGADEMDRGEVVVGGREDEAASDLEVADAAGGLPGLRACGQRYAAGHYERGDGCDPSELTGPGAERIATSISAMRKDFSPGRAVVHSSLLPDIDDPFDYDVYTAAPEYHLGAADSRRSGCLRRKGRLPRDYLRYRSTIQKVAHARK